MNVVDITKFYAVQSGGVKTYLDAKMKDFAARGVRHTLLIPGEHNAVHRIEQTDVWSVRSPVIPFSPSYRLMLSGRNVRTILDITRPDIIEVGSPFIVPRLVWRAIRARPVPTIGFYHSDVMRTYAEPYVMSRAAAPLRVGLRNLARDYVRRTYSRFNVVVAASPRVVRELRDLGLANVRYVPLGVDVEKFRPRPALRAELRARHGIPAAARVGIYAGRFAREKRFDIVLQAHGRLDPENRPHLVFVGEGSDRAMLEKAAAVRGDVTVLPFQSDRTRLAEIMALADFYLACGPGETFGLAIAEAMACGLPPMAVDSGAAADRVASNCGWLYEHGSISSCAVALDRAAREVSSRHATTARRIAEIAFPWSNTFDALIRIYEEACLCREA